VVMVVLMMVMMLTPMRQKKRHLGSRPGGHSVTYKFEML
jgi:hypothetical protein